jgi:hypothetical protein
MTNSFIVLTVMVAVAFVLAAFFPIYLALRADWRANAAGKSAMAFSVVIAVVLGLAVFRRGGYTPPPWVGIVAYVGIIATLLAQDITLVRIQRRQRRRIAREKKEAASATVVPTFHIGSDD